MGAAGAGRHLELPARGDGEGHREAQRLPARRGDRGDGREDQRRRRHRLLRDQVLRARALLAAAPRAHRGARPFAEARGRRSPRRARLASEPGPAPPRQRAVPRLRRALRGAVRTASLRDSGPRHARVPPAHRPRRAGGALPHVLPSRADGARGQRPGGGERGPGGGAPAVRGDARRGWRRRCSAARAGAVRTTSRHRAARAADADRRRRARAVAGPRGPRGGEGAEHGAGRRHGGAALRRAARPAGRSRTPRRRSTSRCAIPAR